MNGTAVKIEIAEVELDERKGRIREGARAGEEYHIRAQVGWLHNGSRYPVKVKLPLEPEQQPYQPGSYSLTADSFQAGDFDKLEFARFPKLAPLVSEVRAAAKVG